MFSNLMHELDVRGLPPPEPFENIIKTLTTLPAGAVLKVHIHREPFPLYEILLDGGYTWQTTRLKDGNFLIRISHTP